MIQPVAEGDSMMYSYSFQQSVEIDSPPIPLAMPPIDSSRIVRIQFVRSGRSLS